MTRRKEYCLEHRIQKLEYATNDNPFSGRIICENCGGMFGRKVWNSTDERLRRIIWRCNGRYTEKGIQGCDSKHLDDKQFYRAFIEVFNVVLKDKEHFIAKWQEQMNSEDILLRVTAKRFNDIFSGAVALSEFDADLYFKLIEKFVVIDKDLIRVCLLDGTELE